MGPGHAWSPACHCNVSVPSETPAGLADGVPGHALAIYHYHTGAAAFTDLRDQAVRLKKRTRVIACDDVATAKAKSAAAINLIVFSFVSDYGQVLRVAHCGTCRNPQQFPT